MVAIRRGYPERVWYPPSVPFQRGRVAYAKRPDLWLAVAEEYRYEVLLDATDQFRALVREIVDAEYPDENNMWSAMYLYDEGILRIYRLSGIRQ